MSTDDRQLAEKLKLRAALAAEQHADLATFLSDMHAADLAELFPDLSVDEQQAVINTLSDEDAANLLDELDMAERALVLDFISLERASDILEEMPTDEAADLLAELPTDEADALLEHMETEAANDVAELLRYSDDTAGGLMVKEFVRVSPADTVADALATLRRHQADAEMIYYLYVLDMDDRLLGVVSLRRLIISDPDRCMTDIMSREFVSVHADVLQHEVAELVRRHGLLAVPVLDDDGHMQGMITVDDIGDVVQEEAVEELLEMSGNEEDEAPLRPAIRRGWKSGFLALVGGLFAANLIIFISHTAAKWPEFAMLLPLLLVLGITYSGQAAVSMDHAFEHAVERHQIARVFMREILSSALLSLIGGLMAWALVLFVMQHAMELALAVALTMALALWTAAISGAVGTVIIRRSGNWLSTTAHTSIIVIGVLLAITVYLVGSGL